MDALNQLKHARVWQISWHEAASQQTVHIGKHVMNKLHAIPIAAVLLCSCAAVPSPQHAARSCFHRDAAAEAEVGYCHALRVGHDLYISGTVGTGRMPDAVRSTYSRLRDILAANGLSYADVVRETVYAVDLDAFIQSKDIRKQFYGSSFPAATWVQVQRLYDPSFVVEVELQARYAQ